MLDLSAVERQMALNEVSFPISTSTKYKSHKISMRVSYLPPHQYPLVYSIPFHLHQV